MFLQNFFARLTAKIRDFRIPDPVNPPSSIEILKQIEARQSNDSSAFWDQKVRV